MSTTWSTYLRNHGSFKAYNQNCGSIANIIRPKESPIANFRRLCENPTLVIMTMSQLNPQVQSAHSCSIIGNTLTDSTPRFMGLTGFGEKAIPIQFDDKNIFPPSSTATPVPTFHDLMQIKTIEDIENLNQPNQSNKKKVKSFCVLPPFLTNHLHSGITDPKQILIDFIQAITELTISTSIQDNTENTTAEHPPAENELGENENTSAEENNETADQEDSAFMDPSGESEESFYHTLLFLWTMIHKQDKLQALTTIPATDSEATEWSNNIHFNCLRKPPSTNQISITRALADGINRAYSNPCLLYTSPSPRD